MKTSEITLSMVKQYCRIDGDADDALLGVILASAKQFACSFTGLNATEIDSNDDIVIAVLALCADMYDQRSAVINVQQNPTVYQILGSHSKNLV